MCIYIYTQLKSKNLKKIKSSKGVRNFTECPKTRRLRRKEYRKN